MSDVTVPVHCKEEIDNHWTASLSASCKFSRQHHGNIPHFLWHPKYGCITL